MVEIVDYVGSTNCYDVHPTEKLVAFEQGNSLLLWDFVMDKKVKMHAHDNEIEAVCFCGVQGNLIASISGGLKCQLFLSEWETLSRQHSVYLPSRHRKAHVKSILMVYVDDQLVIVEVEKQGGYRLSLWHLKADQLNLVFINELEQMSACVGLAHFQGKLLRIVTAEKNMVRYWTLDQSKALLTNKITIKQDVVQVSINANLNLLVVVTLNGSIYIINQQVWLLCIYIGKGDLVSQLKSDQHFMCAAAWESYLFIGCQSGAIIVYEGSTLNYVRTITILDKKSGIKSLKTSSNGETLCCTQQDGSLVAYDAYKSQLMGLQRGHRGRINCIMWDALQKNMLYSVSNDGLLSELTQKGDRFQYRAVDVSQFYDKHNFQGGELFKCKNKQKIKSLCLDHHRDELYVGDSKGQLIVYSLPDLAFKKCINLTQSLAIVDLHFSPAYQYLGVVFSTGFTILLDCENALKPMLKLEDHLRDINIRNKVYKGMRLFQSEFELAKEAPQRYQYHIPRQDKNFLSLTMFNQQAVRQHQIVKEGQILSALALNIFTVDGQIQGFDLHPSKEYVFILSNRGFVAVFKLQTGHLNATIRVPSFSRHLCIDPSGLYFVIANLHTLKEDQNVQLKYNHRTEAFERNSKPQATQEQAQVDNFFASSTKSILPCNLRVYETGTGQLACEVKSIFRITYLTFSSDGEFIVCGGKNGKISIWSLTEEMMESSQEVQAAMKINPFFWKDYPIELLEERKHGELEEPEDTLDLSMIRPKGNKKSPSIQIKKSSKIEQRFQQIVDPKISHEAIMSHFKFTESQVNLAVVNDPLQSEPTVEDLKEEVKEEQFREDTLQEHQM